MQGRYLHKWTSAIAGIEELVVTEWSEALSGLSGEQIAKGIDTLPEDWPPTAMGFRALCEGRSANGFGLNYQPECYRSENRVSPEKRLSSGDRDKKRKKNIAALKELRKTIKL